MDLLHLNWQHLNLQPLGLRPIGLRPLGLRPLGLRPLGSWRRSGRISAAALFLLLALALGPALPALAQTPAGPAPKITVEQLPCLPQGQHGLVRAQVENDQPGTRLRLYFRRLHPVVEDFYWVEMQPEGGGAYWVVFPAPAGETNERHDLTSDRRRGQNAQSYPWAAWWEAKDTSTDRDPNGDLDDNEIRERASVGKELERTWLRGMEPADLQRWLAEQAYEPAEYYASLVNPAGETLARSPVRATAVRDDCPVDLTLQEQGFANNLVIGETAPWQQQNGEPFHWLCDGIVSRVDLAGVLRADSKCRACVIAWWEKSSFLIPASTAGIIGVGGIVLNPRDEPPASPSTP